MDILFANAVACGAEGTLLGAERIMRMAESANLAEVFRLARETGFGGSAPDGIEAMAYAEEDALNRFVEGYAPGKKLSAYFLAECDFQNAEAVVKARRTGGGTDRMLRPLGQFGAAVFERALDGNSGDLPEELVKALTEAAAALLEDGDPKRVDIIFSKALFRYRKRIVPLVLKKAERRRADAKNLLTVLRSETFEDAESMLVDGGTLGKESLQALATEPQESSVAAFSMTPYAELVTAALDAKKAGRPQVAAERMLDGFALSELDGKRYMPTGALPFVLYVLEKMIEIKNFRIVSSSVAAGLDKTEIKERLRVVYEA